MRPYRVVHDHPNIPVNRPVWLAVLQRAGAKFYLYQSRADGFKLVQEFEHAEGRQKEGGLVSDRPGRVMKASHARTAMDPETQAREHGADAFAKRIADFLYEARTSEKAGEFVIAAEPSFLGIVRAQMDDETARHVIAFVRKDLYSIPERDLGYEIDIGELRLERRMRERRAG